jgi:hypothetical protein
LLAFAIDATWDDRQARKRELSYLRLLAADLISTLEINRRISFESQTIDLAGAKLARTYFKPHLPPRDSVLSWFSLVGERRWAGPQLGTARSLVQGGNLDLIRDDSIRAGIPRYLRSMELYEKFEDLSLDDWANGRQELSQYVDLETTILALLPQRTRDSIAATEPLASFPAGELRTIPSLPLEILVMNDQVHRILARMNRDKARVKSNRQKMREVSQKLLSQVERELKSRDGLDQ